MQLKDISTQCHLYSHGAGQNVHAIGAYAMLELASPEGAWDKAKQFLDTYSGKTIMAAFSYELKDDQEQLHSGHPAFIDFPALTLFVPEVVLAWEAGELTVIECNNPLILSKDLLRQVSELHSTTQAPSSCIAQGPLPRETYLKRLAEIQAHIQAGDIYEMNYCQEFKFESVELDPWNTFASLAALTHAPYSCHWRNGDKHLLCASPELFLDKKDTVVRSRPIKGTRKRSSDHEEDQRLKTELSQDLKERAENIMICDLVRNDLSQTALSESVIVEELCAVYSYETVHQMISSIRSEVSDETHPLDIIKHCFPMGSMTGAPKIRAMEIIEELEDFRRGIYSGAVGMFSPARDFTLNVVIRSILFDAREKRASVAAGGAITALSDPRAEYDESLLKAKAMMEVLGMK